MEIKGYGPSFISAFSKIINLFAVTQKPVIYVLLITYPQRYACI